MESLNSNFKSEVGASMVEYILMLALLVLLLAGFRASLMYAIQDRATRQSQEHDFTTKKPLFPVPTPTVTPTP